MNGEKTFKEQIVELADEIMALKFADTRLTDGVEQLNVVLKELMTVNKLTLSKLVEISKQNSNFPEIVESLNKLIQTVDKLESTMHKLDDGVYRLGLKIEEESKRRQAQEKLRDSVNKKILEKLEEV
jgi:chromosome segregation ATPase